MEETLCLFFHHSAQIKQDLFACPSSNHRARAGGGGEKEDVQIDSSLRELEKNLLNEVSFHANATSAVAWNLQLSRGENSSNTEKEQYRAI